MYTFQNSGTKLRKFSGNSEHDPYHFLQGFVDSCMASHNNVDGKTLARKFPSALSGMARNWLASYQKSQADQSWEAVQAAFIEKY